MDWNHQPGECPNRRWGYIWSYPISFHSSSVIPSSHEKPGNWKPSVCRLFQSFPIESCDCSVVQLAMLDDQRKVRDRGISVGLFNVSEMSTGSRHFFLHVLTFFSIFSSCGYLIPNFCTSSCPWTSRCLQISVAQNPDLGNSFFGMFSSWSSRFATAWKKIHVPGKGAVSVARSLRGLRRHRHPIWRTSIGLGKLQRPHCNLDGIMISKEHHPQMTFIQVSEIL